MTGNALAWSPLVPLPLLLLLAGAALLLVAFAAWRGARGWWLRLLAAAALLLGLANPSLVEEQRQGLTDIALVLVDESASQDIGLRRAQSEQALADLLARLGALPNTEIEVIRAGAGEEGHQHDAADEQRVGDGHAQGHRREQAADEHRHRHGCWQSAPAPAPAPAGSSCPCCWLLRHSRPCPPPGRRSGTVRSR